MKTEGNALNKGEARLSRESEYNAPDNHSSKLMLVDQNRFNFINARFRSVAKISMSEWSASNSSKVIFVVLP
jgi:hypothetical protein